MGKEPVRKNLNEILQLIWTKYDENIKKMYIPLGKTILLYYSD